MATNRIAHLDDDATQARRLLAAVDCVRTAERSVRGGLTALDFAWHCRWGGAHELLRGLSEPAAINLLRRACHAGLLMRDEVNRDSPPVYRLNRPSKAVGSPLDSEVERFRAEQRERHPEDLPGQLRMFGEGA